MTKRKRWYVVAKMDKSDDEIYAPDAESAVEEFTKILARDNLWLDYARFEVEEVRDEPDPRV